MNTLLNLADTERGVGVLKSTLPVVEAARHVWIDERAVSRLAQTLAAQGENSVMDSEERWCWSDGSHKAANVALVLHSWNFSFWAEDQQPRWTVEVAGQKRNGYRALIACVRRALDDGIELHNAKFLSKLKKRDLARIFRGEGEIPMLAERLANAREVGRVLLANWNGDFCEMLKACEGSAVTLTEMVAQEFPSFHDQTIYYGREVKFLKRAQILVADLKGAMGDDPLVAFHDLDQLSAFADYKIPQVLEGQGVLRYSPSLQTCLERGEKLPAGGPQEVEIRSAMVWAVELLRREIHDLGLELAAHQLDSMLWEIGQEPVANERPYHRTRTIFY